MEQAMFTTATRSSVVQWVLVLRNRCYLSKVRKKNSTGSGKSGTRERNGESWKSYASRLKGSYHSGQVLYRWKDLPAAAGAGAEQTARGWGLGHAAENTAGNLAGMPSP